MNLESPFLAEDLLPGADGEATLTPFLDASSSFPAPLRGASPQAEQEAREAAEWLMESEIGVIGGRDERRRVQDTLAVPFCWIGSISVQRQIQTAATQRKTGLARAGSGLLISPCHVLTAAHVLKSVVLDDQDRVKERHEPLLVEVALGRDGGTTPFASIRAKRWDLHPKYDPEKKGSAYDYAVITLDTAIGTRVFKSLKGRPLAWWGHPGGTDATLAQLPAAAAERLIGARVVTAGYPQSANGDMKCSSGELHAGPAAQEAALRSSRRVEQWIRTSPTFMLTADATEGQSGSPVWTVESGRRYLLGILVRASTDLNHAITLSDDVLKQVAAWTGGAALIAVPTAAATQAGEAQADEQGSNEWETDEQEDGAQETDAQEADEADEAEEARNGEDESVEHFDSAADPFAGEEEFEHVSFEHDQPADAAAIEQAIQGGERDPNALTNLVFFARHPELPREPLKPTLPKYKALTAEWARILEQEVWPTIQAASANADLVVTGAEVASHDRFFWGKSGKRLKKLVEDAARDVGLNPGLLGTIMMAETRRPRSYLSSEKVSSYHIGVDDFYEGRGAIKARVPAYRKVRWDTSQTPESHLNDAKTNPRMVKTIWFADGPAAVMATAVYAKYHEVRMRELAKAAGGDFDALPIEARFALTRMGMAAGTSGAKQYLDDALAGKDIMVRKAIAVVAYQTKRNATVRTAQALHLSDWIFGIPLQPVVPAAPAPGSATQPELEDFAVVQDEWAGEAGEHDELEASDAREGEDSEDSEDNEVEVFDAFEADPYAGEDPVVLEREDLDLPKREVSVGERIVLDLATTSLGSDVATVRWTIPGRAIRGYDGTVNTAKVFELTEGDLKQPKITFYWVDAGDARKVRAAIRTKAGVEKTLSATFDVKRPKMEAFTAAVGKTRIETRGGLTGMRFGKLIAAPGIKWEWKIKMAAGHAGHVKDVQTVQVDVTQVQHLSPGSAQTRTLVRRHPVKTDPHVQLDGTVDGQAAYSAGTMEPLIAGGESFAGGASDSPHTELPKLAKTVTVNQRFTYYVMFKPETRNPNDAIWVPIAKATWFWKAAARHTGSSWDIDPARMKPVFDRSTEEFPTYQSNVEENEWQVLEEKTR